MINRLRTRPENYEATVEAAKHTQEGAYFVFSGDASQIKKVLTVKASIVSTIETDLDN